MPDTTNKLSALRAAIACAAVEKPTDEEVVAMLAALDEIVRQAREGMVPQEEAHHWQMKYEEAAQERDEAERKLATAQREAWVAGVRWMCEKFSELPQSVRAAFDPASGDAVFYRGERIENIAASRYPAPTGSEGTRTECGANEPCADCGHLRGSHISNGAHPEQVPCWAFVDTNKYCGCNQFRPTPPQAAPEPVVVVEATEMSDGGYKVLLTPADCQRIVEMAQRASGREG